ncbi:peroxide stress protein YaaA [Psychrobacter urativorans]|uniref:peroxide stress protein YaaA n=1 Tax=Psychrobacter urativorans TaxID=45610 RepID=UPI00191A98C3|nr:peroxide stress protein YaaA [Psychrobacter urativorans]
MYFVLSPAKALNENDAVPLNLGNHYSQPAFIDNSTQLMKSLKSKDPLDLQELMSISAELATLNAARNQEWQLPFTIDNAKPASYLFDGDVYTGLDSYSMDKEAILYLNEHLGILSGLYGVLKPLDLMQPYRLEMGTKLKNERGDNLYDFWGEQITDLLNERIKTAPSDSNDNILINLASNEYFKAVKKKALDAEIITPRFEDEKNGKYKVISFYAKKARGLMVKYAADNKLTNAEQLKKFNLAGYYYCKDASDDKMWTFRRDVADQ